MKFKHLFILALTSLSMMLHHQTVVYASNKNEMLIEISDETGVWKTTTHIDLFKMSYINEKGNTIINSDHNDKIIAPGSENSYALKINNRTGDPIEYTLTMYVDVHPQHLSIPIITRIKENDFSWIVGDEDTLVPITNLNHVKETVHLNSNSSTYYTLDWRWPYESLKDEYDTYLGNIAENDDVSIKVTFNVVAKLSKDTFVDTGDNHHVYSYILFLSISLIGLCCMTKKGTN